MRGQTAKALMNTVIELTVARLKPAIKPLGLSVVLLDHPEHIEYLKEWEVKDSEGWIYATIGTLADGHDIILAKAGDKTRCAICEKVDTAIKDAYNLASHPPSKLVELENEYLALEIEEELLRGRIKAANEQIKLDEKRLYAIVGGLSSEGKLKSQKEKEIYIEKTRLKDDTLVRPVFRDRPQEEENYRVSRVTPRCVFLKSVGSTREDRYRKDGSNWTTGLKDSGFDLEATIKRFEEAKRNG